jgi:hypothetical protein
MFCNHKSVSVTRNLVEALRTFRHTRKSRVLWADAICINQQDLEERSLQVQLMTRIFSDASRVLIWLGHGDFFLIQVALNYICRCINHYTKDVLSEGEYAQYYWNGKEVDTRNDGASSPEGKIGDFTLKALQYLSRLGCSRSCPSYNSPDLLGQSSTRLCLAFSSRYLHILAAWSATSRTYV